MIDILYRMLQFGLFCGLIFFVSGISLLIDSVIIILVMVVMIVFIISGEIRFFRINYVSMLFKIFVMLESLVQSIVLLCELVVVYIGLVIVSFFGILCRVMVRVMFMLSLRLLLVVIQVVIFFGKLCRLIFSVRRIVVWCKLCGCGMVGVIRFCGWVCGSRWLRLKQFSRLIINILQLSSGDMFLVVSVVGSIFINEINSIILVVKLREKLSRWLEGFWLIMLNMVLMKVVLLVNSVNIKGDDIVFFFVKIIIYEYIV